MSSHSNNLRYHQSLPQNDDEEDQHPHHDASSSSVAVSNGEDEIDHHDGIDSDEIDNQHLPSGRMTPFCSRVLYGDGSTTNRQSAVLLRILLVLFIILLFINLVLMMTTMAGGDEDGTTIRNSRSSNDVDNNDTRPTNKNKRISSNLNNATIPQWKPLPASTDIIHKIAFGSCNSQDMPQPHWDTISVDYKPDIFVLLGDNVYGDIKEHKNAQNNNEYGYELREAYKQWSQHASVQGGAQSLSVIATLDDHDYGQNNCNVNNPYKDLAKSLFVEFFDLPPLPHDDGVYRSMEFGDNDGRRLQILLLDTRYSHSPFAETGVRSWPYRVSDDDGSEQIMLSENQWQWLEEQIQRPNIDLRILVSSIQVLNDGTGFESWRLFPKERDRLYGLFEKSNTPVVILSGDRHFGAFYESDNNFKEVTASSLTHTIPKGTYHKNCSDLTPLLCDEVDPARIDGTIRENHFGTLEIDWEKRSVELALRRAGSTYGSSYDHTIRSQGRWSDAGFVLKSATYSFADLTPLS